MNTQHHNASPEKIFNPDLYRFDPDSRPPWMVFTNLVLQTVTFNKLDYTKKLIDSIYSKTHLPFTLYIFDQASTDGTAEYLDQLSQVKENIIVKKFKKNIGLGRSYLAAKSVMKGDLLIHFDNDVEILSNYWLVHLLKAYYAYFLAAGNTDIALGMKAINQEEYGFRFSHTITPYYIKTCENALPRTSYSMTSAYGSAQGAQDRLDESVCIGFTSHLWGGVWSISMENFHKIRWEDYYPRAIGGVDTFSSEECRRLNIKLGYIENGPVMRHNDWPYTDEKIQLYTRLKEERAVADVYYIKWKIKKLLARLTGKG